MECRCKDWKENIDALNSNTVISWIHGCSGYTGKHFVYCPWCAKKLKKGKVQEDGNV